MDPIETVIATERIRRLTSLYSHYRDGLHLNALIDLFTGDAELDLGTRYGGTLRGIGAIRRHFAASIERDGKDDPFRTMHVVANHWIDLKAPDFAVGRCFMVTFRYRDPESNPLSLLGIYDDEYKRDGDDWKFFRRRLELAWPPREASSRAPGSYRPDGA